MFNRDDQDDISFSYGSNQQNQSKSKEPNLQNLFLLSNFCEEIFFEIMPKPFMVSTKNCTCHFNLEMLKNISPVITDFIQKNPNEMKFHVNINDEEKVLLKFEQMYQGKTVYFNEDELPTTQRITKNLQIRKCPFYLKPTSLCEADELRSYFNKRHFMNAGNGDNNDDILKRGVELKRTNFINFLRRPILLTFNINTNKKQYKCNNIGIYSSNIIRQILEKDSSINEFNYDFDDENGEFQLICDFFNFNEVNIKSDNMDLLRKFSEDLKIDCILKQIEQYINNYEKVTQKIDEQQTIIDSIDNLFDLLCNVKKYGIEKVKASIVQSEWIQDQTGIEELSAFIIQVIKPSYSLHNEIIELLNELNNEESETNKLNLLRPLIIDKLMNIYMPKNQYLNVKNNSTIVNEVINYNNKYVYLFIRTLYKKNIIPKSEILEKLKNYDCTNNQLNIYFLPEIIEVNPKNIIKLTRKNVNIINFVIFNDSLFEAFKKYLPDKIDLYEKMLDKMEPDDELTLSLRHDDVDLLQKIINTNGIDITKAVVPYNVFDDIEDRVNLLNYAALYGSLKCFKFLFLNKVNIDEDTFYFAVCGDNNEIIKIVDQNQNNIVVDKSEIKKHYNRNSKNNNVSFWYIPAPFEPSFQPNSIIPSKEKYNDENIQYTININYQSFSYLNCCNVNNIIAPTIANHKNKLFDWIFENKFILKGKSGVDLEKIAILSASSGNSHSLIEIIDNGFDLSRNSTRKIILNSARNGFYKLTKLLLNLVDQKAKKIEYVNDNDDDDDYSSDFNSIVHFGSLSIFKLFAKHLNKKILEEVILHSIYMGYSNIINYFFDNLSEYGISEFDEHFIKRALNLSFVNKTDEMFNFFIDRFTKLNPGLFKFDLFKELLNDACSNSNLLAIKTITESILKEDSKFDFSTAFINASSSTNSMSICQYFINKKVFINYEKLSSEVSKLGSLDLEIFELILSNVNEFIKYKFYKCIDNAISSKNKKLVEYLLKINPPNDYELFDAVLTHDVEIVDLILKYNSKPSFINKINAMGTAITVASNNRDSDIVKRLLSVPGINIYIDVSGRDPLILAVSANNLEIVDILLTFIENNYDSNSHILLERSLNSIHNYFQENMKHSKIEWDIIKRFCQVKFVDPNYCSLDESIESDSFLYTACFENEYEMVEFLLNIDRIDINKCDYGCHYSPLMISIEKKNIKIAKLLIKQPKINLNWVNIYNETALTTAVKNGLVEIIDLIINDERFDPFLSKLNIAFIYSNNEIAKKLAALDSLDVNLGFQKNNYHDDLIHLRFNINVEEKYQEINALNHSVEINDIDKIELILNHPSFNKYKSDVNSAIFTSVKNNNIVVFRKLIQLIDDDINNIINENGETLIVFAAMNLSGDIIDDLFMNPNFDNNNNGQINLAFVKSFMKNQVQNNDNNNNNNQNQNRRHFFARNDFHHIWQNEQNSILNQGLIPDKISLIETLQKLLNFDNLHHHLINLNNLLSNGKSFFTIINQNSEDINDISTFLINNNVDLNLPDKNGVFPLEHAIKINSFELVSNLVNSEKIFFSQLKNGSSYLHLAAANDNQNILAFLLDKNIIDINSVNDLGDTPLIEACKAKSIGNINLLFQKENLDYLHRNKNGKDALDVFQPLQENDADLARQNKENYKEKLISLIKEKKSSE